MLINKKTLEYLADLGKLELAGKNEEKLLKDLGNILAHFEELNEVDTENVEPLAGGTIETSVMREDIQDTRYKIQDTKLIEAFPEKEDNYLKVPPVFE